MAAACAALVDVTGVYRRFVAGGAVRDLGAPVATFHFVPGASRLELYPAEILRRETLERTSAHLRIGVEPALAAARARFDAVLDAGSRTLVDLGLSELVVHVAGPEAASEAASEPTASTKGAAFPPRFLDSFLEDLPVDHGADDLDAAIDRIAALLDRLSQARNAHAVEQFGPGVRARFSLPPTFGGLVDIPWARQRIERAVTISARSSAEAVACLGAWLAAIHTGSEAGAAEVSTDPGGRGETTPPGLRTGSLEVRFTLPLAAI